MASTVAAMKGKLGNTNYYIIAMKAKELVEKAVIPSEMPGWDHMELEEREQRDINYNRVKNQIAPYLATDKDRFFGAIILTAKGLDESNFEPLGDIATKGLPKLYKTQAEMMGFLTFTGGEQLIPLDGQHRLKAIQFAIEGIEDKFRPNLDLANEDVTVILVPYEASKARKIFTKVNRYAKPTTTGQNLVTDDDDIIAILSRSVANEIIGPDLVKYKSNTLSDKEPFFTTLATLAKCNLSILNYSSFPPIVPTDRTSPVSSDREKLYRDKIMETWNRLTEDVEKFADMLSDKTTEAGDKQRKEMRKDYLISRPVAQVCLVSAYAKLTNSSHTEKEAIEKLNKIDWRINVPLWDRLLVTGGKILTKNENIATDVICYIAGEPLTKEREEELLSKYRKLFPPEEQKKIKLPKQV